MFFHPIITLCIAGGIGAIIGYFLRIIITVIRKNTLEMTVTTMMLEAREAVSELHDEARRKIEEKETVFQETVRTTTDNLQSHEQRLIKKEQQLERKNDDIQEEAEVLKEQAEQIRKIRAKAEELEQQKQLILEQTARLTTAEARESLFTIIENQSAEDLLIRAQKNDRSNDEEINRRAKTILAMAIERVAVSTAQEHTTTTVILPSEESKGKIIGKEGRNIRAFERIAGVELLIDETPNAIIISSFNPIRREIARNALEALIKDGRIQPAKIEELLNKATEETGALMKEMGEKAVYECGIYNLPPQVVAILGRLHFRTSYGQNVLQHSIEMTHMAGILATELGADVSIAKAGALVHDIGKALDHEVEGTHIAIGMRILEKYQTDPRIITAMKSHHGDYPHESIESVIVQTTDHISGGRPGARRDTIEQYLKRLSDLEMIVNKFDGVQKTYALQAGREIRVFVTPEKINDLQSRQLARTIALEIEKELSYPGEIKITVIRENRVIDYAR